MNDADFRTLREIASDYDMALAKVRSMFDEKLTKLSEGEQKIVFEKGEGRRGARYRNDFVIKVMGCTSVGLSEQARHVFGKNAKGGVIRVSGGSDRDPLIGILASRQRAVAEYQELVAEMMKEPGLRIRCIAGTDFFGSQTPCFESLRIRKAEKLDPAKVLLVCPLGHGAEIRTSSEGEDLSFSQFRRDAWRTFLFVKDYMEEGDVRWADELPPSLLIWTEKGALVEPYDYGGRGLSLGCVGRKAPLLAVPAGTYYHTALKESFDFVYEEKCPSIKIYRLFGEVQEVFHRLEQEQNKVKRKRQPIKR